MTGPLHRDIDWLHGLLDEVSPATLTERLVREVAAAVTAGDEGEASLDRLSGVSPEELGAVLKRLTIRFHLRNKAEQHHIVRVNREREKRATPDEPRSESLAETVRDLAGDQASRARLLALIGELDIQPTLTAHPTEVRRQAILQKQWAIGSCLTEFDDDRLTQAARGRLESRVRQTLSLQLATDEIRSQRLSVLDEVRNGLFHLTGVIWETVPTIHRDLADALNSRCGADESAASFHAFLQYRTWIGGDRDGNPNVTAEVTAETIAMMRAAAVMRWDEALGLLFADLSVSSNKVPILPELLEDLAGEAETAALSAEESERLRNEPLRRKIVHMRRKLRDAGEARYSSAALVADIGLLGRALRHAGLVEVAERARLADLLVNARAFGLRLASIDIRQHSERHGSAVGEMLRSAGVCAEYEALDEDERIALLERELMTDRPLLGRSSAISDSTREALDVLSLVADVRRDEPDAIGSYVISMTHAVSDLLEVLVLMREAGLWRRGSDGAIESDVDVTPLFETVADLEGSEPLLERLFASEAYGAHLRARGNFQEIMLGYSDSNKDGGYWMANWRLYKAQRDIARVCGNAGVGLRFFHGRGGSVARGGGRAQRAIRSSPPESQSGCIRFTEQGEVITFRYAMPDLARRHLEQIVGAVLASSAAKQTASAPDKEGIEPLMDALSALTMSTYRDLIDRADFWEWFVDRSPVQHIGDLQIASRPVSRSGGAMRFDSLRAIPWVFSWTQMRFNVPGWYGVGTAFGSLVLDDPAKLELCRRAYRKGGYFRVFIDNAQQEMARARLPIARWYVDEKNRELLTMLTSEFERARRTVLEITGQDELLDNNVVIQQSIAERNVDADALNVIQIELLRRYRETEDPEIQRFVLLSVNGLAAAMQSTG